MTPVTFAVVEQAAVNVGVPVVIKGQSPRQQMHWTLPGELTKFSGTNLNRLRTSWTMWEFYYHSSVNGTKLTSLPSLSLWGGWGCEVSCGGHHRLTGRTTTGSALDGAVFDIAQILAYLVHNMSRSQLYLGFGHFGWLPPFLVNSILAGLWLNFLCWNYSLSSGWHIIAAKGFVSMLGFS